MLPTTNILNNKLVLIIRMDQRKRLIVGIDPGTTTGYAILDTSGNLLHADSSKNLGLSELISVAIRFGKVIVVGTDKRKTPDLVYKFAAKLGARIIHPKEDMGLWEKKDMTRGFAARNEHENDALASAFLAYREIRRIASKIDGIEIADRELVKELVIKSGVSIDAAIKSMASVSMRADLVPREKTPEIKRDFNIGKLMNRLRIYEKEIHILRKQISALKSVQAVKIPENKEDKKPDFNKKIDSLLRFKESRLKSYVRLLGEKDSRISALSNEIGRMAGFIMNSGDFYILKRMRNLGCMEFQHKKSRWGISKGDMLLVDDLNIASEKVLKEIEGKVDVIIYRNPVSRRIKEPFQFSLVKSDALNIADYGHFAAVRKEELDRELRRKDSLLKVINDYKMQKEINGIMHHS